MIKINLLPQQKRSKPAAVNKDLLFYFSFLLMLLLLVFGVHTFYSEKIAELKSDVSKKAEMKKQLQTKVAGVEALVKDVEQIQSRIKIIKDVRIRQGLPVKYIDEIVVNMPESKIWLESFSMAGNGQISMSGVIIDNHSFARYVDALRASKYISVVDTKRTSRRTIDGLDLISFQCSIIARDYVENFESNGTKNG